MPLLLSIKSTALKSKVDASHIWTNAAHSLLNGVGFEWFGDQKEMDATILDMKWRNKDFKWYVKKCQHITQHILFANCQRKD